MAEPLRILIIEDEAVDRESVRRALMRSDVNVVVEEATDVASGLAKLTAGAFDCAIVDFHLPDGDAWDFLDARDIMDQLSGESYCKPPLVILTAHGSEMAAVEFLKAGASDYLPKSELTSTRIAKSVRNAVRIGQIRKQTAQALGQLQQAEACCRYLFDQSSEAMVMADLDGKIVEANSAACRLYRAGRDDIVGKNVADAVLPDRRQEASRGFRERIRSNSGQWERAGWLSESLSVPVDMRFQRTAHCGQPAVLVHIRPAADRGNSP